MAQTKSAATNATADVRAGITLLQSGHCAEAVGRFSEAIKLDRHAADAWVWRGICENQLTRYHAAVADFRAALRVDPGALPAHYNLALSLLRLGDIDEAQHQLEIVTAADPSAVEAQYNLALLLEKHQKYAEARDHLGIAMGARPNDPGVMQHLLLDDLILKKSVEAEEQIQHLLTEATPEFQIQTGKELLGLGYFPQAATLLEAAQQRLPASRGTSVLLARAYIGAEQGAKAIPLLTDAAAADPSNDAAYLLGLAYVSTGSRQQAAEAFRLAINANARDAGALFQLAMLEEREGTEHRAEALADLREAVRWEPQNATYTMALGRLLLETDHAPEALAVLSRTQQQDEKTHESKESAADSGEFALLLGIAQAATSGVSAARPTLIRAVELSPGLALAHNVLGFCYFSEGHYAEAAAAYRRSSDLLPANDVFAYDTALAFERAGAYADAMVYAQRAAALADSTGEDHYLLGKLYLQVKDRESAIRELKTAAGMKPDLESPYYLLARTYMQQGNGAEAKQWSDQLTLLKQKHNPLEQEGMGSSTQKNAVASQKPAVASSLLLQGAPVKMDDTREGR